MGLFNNNSNKTLITMGQALEGYQSTGNVVFSEGKSLQKTIENACSLAVKQGNIGICNVKFASENEASGTGTGTKKYVVMADMMVSQ
ncbi:hypothetical protein AYR54_03865 [Loigolactobacillus backii]|uniref:hypothetical protein n=1 Tax=Loigolactobacillus backii TaxID=375175 RepID=UPI0007F0AF19|nr:hypothetical protein [Loigolactobacillus backii]ANK59454.1 hypothetical protein AYR52_03855 [Loigolactobacillus backii]ANK64447.1 hypothetical protein AYR54_03865 [Loigolactobacillus backii]ANK67157.1 hypothetical protein AYR55_05170 [Loigolactobacillus backii]OLF69498.1 hypothetical protein ACX53_07615 [Loigolactobacillus backii]PIO87802.1 hypothetical protein B8A32_11925 [Loigolactobacillus backii]